MTQDSSHASEVISSTISTVVESAVVMLSSDNHHMTSDVYGVLDQPVPHHATGDINTLISNLRKAHAENPTDKALLLELRRVLRQASRYYELLRVLDNLVKLTVEPQVKRSYLIEAAETCEQLNNPHLAEQYFNAAQLISPVDPERFMHQKLDPVVAFIPPGVTKFNADNPSHTDQKLPPDASTQLSDSHTGRHWSVRDFSPPGFAHSEFGNRDSSLLGVVSSHDLLLPEMSSYDTGDVSQLPSLRSSQDTQVADYFIQSNLRLSSKPSSHIQSAIHDVIAEGQQKYNSSAAFHEDSLVSVPASSQNGTQTRQQDHTLIRRKQLQKLIEKHPLGTVTKDDARSLQEIACIAFYEFSQFEVVQKYLERACELDEKIALAEQTFIILNHIYSQQADFTKLAELYERRIKHMPSGKDRDNLSIRLAQINYENLNNKSRSLEIIEELFDNDVQNVFALKLVAKIAAEDSNYSAAKSAREKLCEQLDIQSIAGVNNLIELAEMNANHFDDFQTAKRLLIGALEDARHRDNIFLLLEALKSICRTHDAWEELYTTLVRELSFHLNMDLTNYNDYQFSEIEIDNLSVKPISTLREIADVLLLKLEKPEHSAVFYRLILKLQPQHVYAANRLTQIEQQKHST